jgi:hypothetical protein
MDLPNAVPDRVHRPLASGRPVRHEAIRRELVADFEPVGALESVLVDRLAAALAMLPVAEPIGGLERYRDGRGAWWFANRAHLRAFDLLRRHGGVAPAAVWAPLRALRILQRARDRRCPESGTLPC